MNRRNVPIAIVVSCAVYPALADDTLYRYEGNVLPYDASAGWAVYNACEPPCFESLEGGQFVLSWDEPADLANYSYRIAEPPDAPPLHSGSSGASGPTTRSGPISGRVTAVSPSTMAECTIVSTCTEMRSFQEAVTSG